ncbi:hypothetical protein Tco_0210335 [Tanacetum coccineum]
MVDLRSPLYAKLFRKLLGSRLDMSTAFIPQSDGQNSDTTRALRYAPFESLYGRFKLGKIEDWLEALEKSYVIVAKPLVFPNWRRGLLRVSLWMGQWLPLDADRKIDGKYAFGRRASIDYCGIGEIWERETQFLKKVSHILFSNPVPSFKCRNIERLDGQGSSNWRSM